MFPLSEHAEAAGGFDKQFVLVINRLVGYSIFHNIFEVLFCISKTKKMNMNEAIVGYLVYAGISLKSLAKLKIPYFSFYDGMHLLSLKREARCFYGCDDMVNP